MCFKGNEQVEKKMKYCYHTFIPQLLLYEFKVETNKNNELKI